MDGAAPSTIVVAEDDASVRELIVTTLRRRGMTALHAVDGPEAMALIERDDPAIDLLVSDVMMPGMGGPELVALARASHPGLPVVLISGYNPKLLPQGSIAPDVTLLEKPFTSDDLIDAIEEALGRVKTA